MPKGLKILFGFVLFAIAPVLLTVFEKTVSIGGALLKPIDLDKAQLADQDFQNPRTTNGA